MLFGDDLAPIEAGRTAVGDLIADIDALLATNNMSAEELTLQLHDVLEGRGFDMRLEHLEEAVDQLDYSSARKILAELVNDLVLSDDVQNEPV